MERALRIRLLPVTPWRVGAGAAGGQDPVYHSDALFSALCSAASALGWLDEWLAAAAAPAPAVRFSSCFPFARGNDFVPPPLTLWPPSGASPKVRWKTARFVPLSVVRSLLSGENPAEDRWVVDPASGCLIPIDRQGAAVGPFRPLSRSHASVDRLTPGIVAPHRVEALQFAPGAGLWCVALFRDPAAQTEWRPRVEAAFRYLADSGFGGLRSRGFGRCAPPKFENLTWPLALVGQALPPANAELGQDLPVPPPLSAGNPSPDGDNLPNSTGGAAPCAGVPSGSASQAAGPESSTNASPPPGPDLTTTPDRTHASRVPDQPSTYWLLSLFHPADAEPVDFSSGAYSTLIRRGRIESPAGWGAEKNPLTMVAEGSVLVAPAQPEGSAQNVAPEGFPHPVWRAGFAVAVPLPARKAS
jgi:CRISPR type III-A-associated RAMP protein Csm4